MRVCWLPFILIFKVFRLFLDFFCLVCIYIFSFFFFFCFLFVLFSLCHLFVHVFIFLVVYLGNGSRHGLWLIVSCGGGGVATDGEVRGFFISSALCSGIWMSASSKHHSCQVLIIVNEFHLLHRFPFPPADSRQRAGPTWDVGAQLIE